MHSMTGYGRAAMVDDGREITIELKSVNHRFLDISMRLPRSLNFLEDTLRKELANTLARGHIDVFVLYRNTRQDARKVMVDEKLANTYRTAISGMAREMALAETQDITFFAKLPDVLTVIENDEDIESVKTLAIKALHKASQDLVSMRQAEGKIIVTDMQKRVELMRNLLQQIETRAPTAINEYRQKLANRIAEILQTPISEDRLAQEVAVFADRSCIDEEIVRLNAHFVAFANMCNVNEAQGRKIDFLIQEMNRETNTIGSKVNDASLASLVISLKSEIEKIREQAQNIE